MGKAKAQYKGQANFGTKMAEHLQDEMLTTYLVSSVVQTIQTAFDHIHETW